MVFCEFTAPLLAVELSPRAKKVKDAGIEYCSDAVFFASFMGKCGENRATEPAMGKKPFS